MGVLYEGIFSNANNGEPAKIKIAYWFQALMAEYGAGDLTGPAATSVFEQKNPAYSPVANFAPLGQEILDIVATVTGITVPALPTAPGTPTLANLSTYATQIRDYFTGVTNREKKIRRLGQILSLAEQRATGYDTAALIRSKLGVPTR